MKKNKVGLSGSSRGSKKAKKEGTEKDIISKKLKLVTFDMIDYKKLCILKAKLQKSEMEVIRYSIRLAYELSKEFSN